MKNITLEIKDFLHNHRVGVLSIALADGDIHGAAIHYSYTTDPLAFFFSTHDNTRKCNGIIHGEKQKASLVIGFAEKEWITFQADGIAYIIRENDELKKVHEIHTKKFPENKGREEDESSVFIKFFPEWWRYSDFTTYPVKFIKSIGK